MKIDLKFKLFAQFTNKVRVEQVNPIDLKIEISTIDNEAPSIISLASISCAQQNRNEEDMLQTKIITRKDQMQQLI